MKPRALILHANGTNRDTSLAHAFELAGASTHIVPLNDLKRSGSKALSNYDLLAIPGGFSYGDVLGAGKLLALDLQTYFFDELAAFVAAGKPVLGICNGFQALIKSGVLPGPDLPQSVGGATLTHNAQGNFTCRWVTLNASPSGCLWTDRLVQSGTPIDCPVAHGEGRFVVESDLVLSTLKERRQIALQYTPSTNPNGSTADIAGICNSQGNVLGLMPHPEDHIFAHQYPGFSRKQRGHLGLALFENAVRHVC